MANNISWIQAKWYWGKVDFQPIIMFVAFIKEKKRRKKETKAIKASAATKNWQMFYFGSNKIYPFCFQFLNRKVKPICDGCWHTIIAPFQGLIFAPKAYHKLYAHTFNATRVHFSIVWFLMPNSEQKWSLFSHGSIYIWILLWLLKILKVHLVHYSNDKSLDLKCKCWVGLHKWAYIKLFAMFMQTIWSPDTN